ncbi:MAG TPA: SRPBCC family protein [Gaiellaceae bacterium]|nr:SRPBCC family protein [Gaiellaceae bacterium]
MTTTTETAVTTQVHRVYITASPEQIWEAITSPEWTAKYGYHGIAEYDLKPGGTYRVTAPQAMQEMGMPELLLDGEVIEADPPRKLVQTWHALWDEGVAGEQPTRVTWDIEADDGGITRLTVTHELEGAPIHAEQVSGQAKLREGGGGWSWILSDLKTLLETGKAIEL